MKTFINTFIAAVFLFSLTAVANKNYKEKKTVDVSKCKTCKGSNFVVKSDHLSIVRLYDEYGNIIDISHIDDQEELKFTFSALGTYYLEMFNSEGEMIRKKLVVKE